jgi:predicted transporter
LSTQLEDPSETSIAELFHQLVDDSRQVVHAEINLYREIALHRANKAKGGLIALAVGAVMFLGALIVLILMLAEGLAIHIGPVAAGLVVAGVVAILGYLLIRYGASRLSVLTGDEEERGALSRAERKP